MTAINSSIQDTLSLMVSVTMAQLDESQESPISARELHAFLRVDKDFSDWIKAQIKRAGLQEHCDYECSPFRGNQTGRGGDRRSIEYNLTPRAAKHIAMMSRTEMGREVRNYFLDCERRCLARTSTFKAPTTLSEALRQAADFMDPRASEHATTGPMRDIQIEQALEGTRGETPQIGLEILSLAIRDISRHGMALNIFQDPHELLDLDLPEDPLDAEAV